jgi:hypothetical protein
MNFSIFDLYEGPSKKAVKLRQPYTYSKQSHEVPASPDSVQWEDSSMSPKGLPALPKEQANAEENRAERQSSTFSTFHPEVYLEQEPAGGARRSVYGPVRFWSRSRRPSRNFSEAYSYLDNLKCMQHFHSTKQPDRALLNSSSHPRLSQSKPRLKRSLPEENSRSLPFQASEALISRQHVRHVSEKKPSEVVIQVRNSLNYTMDPGKKVTTLPQLGALRVSTKKAGVRKTL